MVHKLRAIGGGASLLLLPVLAFAQTDSASTDGGIGGAVANISSIVGSFIPLLLTLAVVIFLWGLVKYLFKIGGDEGVKGGVQTMIWGVVAIFVMVSIWGLVSLLRTTLNIEDVSGQDVANPEKLQIQ
jgi:hypothetical protein